MLADPVCTDLTVGLDYGQFTLETGEEDPGLAVELLSTAFEDGIAQRGDLVVVLSPHQNNFEMAFRVEVWPGEPSDDVDDWEEAFAVHLEVGEHGLVYSSPTMDFTHLPVPPGSYRALITGRGFVAHGWPGSTKPGDQWRLRLWPSTMMIEPARLKAYTEPVIAHPAEVFKQQGVDAVSRIHQALHDATGLITRRATVRVQRRMPGTRRKLFSGFRHPNGWLTSSGGGIDDDHFNMGGDTGHPYFGDANHIVPCAGDIECTLISAKAPAHVEFTWSWVLRPHHRRTPDERDERRPDGPIYTPPLMTLRFDLANADPEPNWPTTLVTVTHDGVPADLAEDLTRYWLWVLERADYSFDLSEERTKHARQH